ncbi:MAG: hypothetical protein FGM27_02275 [Candidatus Omnitrophica bacterium]|nr:hypothetical protein [Candidatus Omnitrophota bacterium]
MTLDTNQGLDDQAEGEKGGWQELTLQESRSLLEGWFNNKMMVMMLLFHPRKGTGRDWREVRIRQLSFLEDIKNHFFRAEDRSREADRALTWLKRYFERYPESRTYGRISAAFKMQMRVYRGVGLRCPSVFEQLALDSKRTPSIFKAQIADSNSKEKEAPETRHASA